MTMGQKEPSAFVEEKETPQEERRGGRFSQLSTVSLLILVLFLAGIVWYGFYSVHIKEIAGSDDREYVSIARNIVNGKGIVRNFIFPVDINFFNQLPVPEFMHPPGYPLILAGFFKLFGTHEFAALLPSYVSYFILVLLFFFFARSKMEGKTATLAVIILIFNREILQMSLVALSEGVYTLVFFLSFIVFVKANSLKTIFVSGFILGVSHLIRENIYPFLIPLFFYLYFYPPLPRWKKMVFFLIGFLIPILPNVVRNFLTTGSPFFSYGKFTLMAFTDKYPWLNIYRDIENPSLFKFLMEDLGLFFLKYVSNLVTATEKLLSVSNLYLLAFALVEMFNWKNGSDWRRIKLLFLSLLISQIFFISLFTFTSRFFTPFLPLIILFGAQAFQRLSKSVTNELKSYFKKGIPSPIIYIFILFFTVPTLYAILRPDKPAQLNFKAPPFGFLIQKDEAEKVNDFLRKELKGDEVVWTDLHEILAWEGGRLCGWLPTRIKTIYEIHSQIPVDAILLTSVRTPYRMEEEWRYLLYSQLSLPRYRTIKLYQSQSVFAKLLVRDERE
jgi:4-amino-4-deoxy-L-arabinose transferase-like glycosyltransferase